MDWEKMTKKGNTARRLLLYSPWTGWTDGRQGSQVFGLFDRVSLKEKRLHLPYFALRFCPFLDIVFYHPDQTEYLQRENKAFIF